jgi:hypothetical protein
MVGVGTARVRRSADLVCFIAMAALTVRACPKAIL